MAAEREAFIAARLTAVRARIERAVTAAGREPGSVSLIVITKTFPASDVRILAGLGVRDVGENKHQDAEVKAAACADLDLRWHFVGRLQSNKAAAVATYADLVHSVDSEKLVTRLGGGAVRHDRTVRCLIQVSLDPPEARTGAGAGRGGIDPAGVPDLARLVAQTPGLLLGGVMAVAPLDGSPGEAFARLARISAALQAEHPRARVVSAGMSGDFEEAIAAGATHVRVGSAILGDRPPLR